MRWNGNFAVGAAVVALILALGFAARALRGSMRKPADASYPSIDASPVAGMNEEKDRADTGVSGVDRSGFASREAAQKAAEPDNAGVAREDPFGGSHHPSAAEDGGSDGSRTEPNEDRSGATADGPRVGQTDAWRRAQYTRRVTRENEKMAVETVDLEKLYGEGSTTVRALKGVSLGFPAGEFAAIMGPSGSGKSTLLHILGALDKPSAGRVNVGGAELSGLSDRRLTLLRRQRMGFVFQFFNLIPTLTAEENILLPALIAGEKTGGYASRLDELLELVGLLGRRTHRPDELSGGEQQRVAIARALIRNPDIVLADEPTGNLDSKTGAGVLGLLRESAARYQQTTIMVTHDPRAAASADRVIFLADGRVVDEARNPEPDQILERIKTLESTG